MAKFNLSITAHVGNDCMVIYSKDFDDNITNIGIVNRNAPVYDRLITLMPCADWTIDDGDDERGTTYCQYTHYEKGTDNYLLGVWTEIDEQTGYMK